VTPFAIAVADKRGPFRCNGISDLTVGEICGPDRDDPSHAIVDTVESEDFSLLKVAFRNV
jgi:hypothetical protein